MTLQLDGPHAHALAEVARLIGPGGALARGFPGYEQRDAQLAFALDVARALAGGGVLLAEAPTGVGKSLGYLVPALLWSRREREPIVVSTHTKQLQDQLTEVDAPRLSALLDVPAKVVRLKGRANYLCPRRWRLARAEHFRKGKAGGALEKEASEWVADSKTHDLDEFDFGRFPGGTALRAKIACEPTFCSPGACKTTECAWRRARQKAAHAEILVVNHALLVTGLPGGNVLPPFRALIVDEAHHLDAVFTSQSTVRQSLPKLDLLLSLVHAERRSGADLLALVRAGSEGRLKSGDRAELEQHLFALAGLAQPMRAAAHGFFAQVAQSVKDVETDPAYEPRARFRQVEDVIGELYDPLERLFSLGQEGETRWRATLSTLARAEATPEVEELSGDVAAALAAWQEWQSGLKFLTDPRDHEFVYWRGGARAESAEIAAAPVDVARRVQQHLWNDRTSLVLTSATLTAGGSFRYVRERLGLADDAAFDVAETVYPSPFDFARQLGAWVYDPGGEDGIVQAVEALARTLRRNTLALFTSHLALKRAARRLKPALEGTMPVWAQELDGSAIELARRFRDARGALLLGTASFWEGVDFPGEALEVLVVTRLPFAVPTDPLVEARCERIDELGESSFARAMVPEAVLRFRQGVGRLVRRRSDRGVLAILDPRIVNKGYGAHFRRGLPVALRTASNLNALTGEARDFLGDGDT